MKILEIKNGGGYFRISEEGDWKPIDEINKDDLIILLDSFLNSDVEIDDINEKDISNQAQQIIYKSVFEKLNSLKANKSKFKDEADRAYLDAIEKYSKS